MQGSGYGVRDAGCEVRGFSTTEGTERGVFSFFLTAKHAKRGK
jgi:hypothetical protein